MSKDHSESADVLWEGRPWVLPGFVGVTIEAIFFFVAVTWLELIFLKVGSIFLVEGSYALVGIFWLLEAAKLEVVKESNEYTLRGSSLEVRHGIVGKRILTLSAAGFSDLEVTKGITGRLLNMGDIVLETDSDRDIRLTRIRDPIEVASKIRDVMTVPMVRTAAPRLTP